MQPAFLTLEDILHLHQTQIEEFGGSPGIRDIGLLESALAMPRQGFAGQFVHGDLFEMAAAYVFHLVKNHPFVDGNKRVGGAAGLVFLDVNGVEIEVSDDAYAEMVLAVAEGKLAKSGIAEFFRKHAARGGRAPLLRPARPRVRRAARTSRRG